MNGDGSITPVRYLRRAGSADEENRSSVCTRLRRCRHCSPIADDIAEADPLPTTRQTGESTRLAALQFLQWAATRDDSVSSIIISWRQSTALRLRMLYSGGEKMKGHIQQLVAWLSGRTSVSGRRTFPVLRSTCS